jgi:hypothetical protein
MAGSFDLLLLLLLFYFLFFLFKAIIYGPSKISPQIVAIQSMSFLY